MSGKFEYLLITAAAGLGDEAHGATTGCRCSLGAVDTAIDRLETRGLLETWMGDATLEAAKDFYHAVIRLNRRVSWVANRTRGVS